MSRLDPWGPFPERVPAVGLRVPREPDHGTVRTSRIQNVMRWRPEAAHRGSRMGLSGARRRLASGLILGGVWGLVSGQTLEAPSQGRGFPEWQRALGDANPAVRAQAVEALGHFGARAVPGLSQALADSDPLVQSRAVQALGQLASTEKTAVLALGHALRSEHWEVRSWTTLALGALGARAAPAIPALIETLHDGDWLVRLGAAQALGQLGEVAAPAVPALLQARTDSDGLVREAVIKALRDMAEKDPGVRDTVLRALGTK